MIDDMEIFRTTISVSSLSRVGAHGLEALNLRIDLGRKDLVPAGPAPAAAGRTAA